MRTLTLPRTALERQIWESVWIDRLSTKPEACLNLKSEWGQSQTPHLMARPNKPGKRPPKDEGSSKNKRTPDKERKEEDREAE